MRSQKSQWLFFDKDSRLKPLSGEETAYWLQLLPKLLKVGVEFEFNLTEQRGMCRGDSADCVCRHVESGCADGCARKQDCETIQIRMNCLNRSSPVCTKADCEECKDFRLNCPEIYCIAYHPNCAICDRYEVNCENCDKKYNPAMDPKNVRKEIQGVLVPTNSWGLPGDNCIAEVTKDGSLRGDKGVEIVTVGRRLEYKSFFDMCKLSIDAAMNRGAYCDERTSIHMHFLISYYRRLQKDAEKRMNTTELDRPMPEVIMANFHQLVRRYQNALTWMSAGLKEPERLTRWEKYRVSVIPYSPYTQNMLGLRSQIMSAYKDYAFVNYDNCRFDKQGAVKRFHFEMRHMDNIPCPSIVTAKACLIYAMVIKAAEISRFGLVEVGDKEWMIQAESMKGAILNNNPQDFQENRFSDTTNVMKYERYFKEQGMDLLYLVKRTLMEFGPQVYDQLVSLVDTPVAFRRMAGKSWPEIEEEFFVPLREEEEINHVIRKIVDLRMMVECQGLNEWFTAVWKEMKQEFPNEVDKNAMVRYVKEQIADGRLQWSEPLGTVI